jgi:hypothetical protein
MTNNQTKNKKVQTPLPRCNALDSDGKRCLKHSGIKVNYHGESEMYNLMGGQGVEVHWVEVNLCIEHAVGVGYDFTKPIKIQNARRK